MPFGEATYGGLKRISTDLDVFRLDFDQWAKKKDADDRGVNVYNIKDFYNFEGQFPRR